MNVRLINIVVLIVVSFICSAGLIYYGVETFQSQRHAVHVINLAGKQRMLSQKMAKEVYLLYGSELQGEGALDELRKAFKVFNQSHSGLIEGSVSLQLPSQNDSTIIEQWQVADGLWNTFSRKIESFLQTPNEETMGSLLAIALEVEAPLLKELNTLVTRIEENAQKQVDKSYNAFKIFGSILSVTILLLIFLGTKLVFQLKSIILRLSNTAGTLSDSSANLDGASKSLVRSTLDQEASVNQTMASMTEIRSIVSKSNESGNICLASTEEVRDYTIAGNKVVAELDQAAESMRSSVRDFEEFVLILKNIRSKTQVINDIVIKTQLLAVNASIEAERAGEYGVGFAVVAEEVGKLALNSGNEAKQIGDLLEESQTQVKRLSERYHANVQENVEVCNKSRNLFQSISAKVQSVSELVRSVADSNNEQEVGIQQVTSAMQSIHSAIHSNSNSARISEEMSSQLRDTAGQIKNISAALAFLGGVRRKSEEEQDLTTSYLKSDTEPQNENIKLVDDIISHSKQISSNSISADDIEEDNLPKAG